MAAHARSSSPEDCEGITDLLRRKLHINDHLLQPAFLRWKYWNRHPLTGDSRSYVLDGKHGIVGHGGRWPMRLLTAAGSFNAFHFIDWAADSTHTGAGLQVLRDSCEGSAALFSVGGTNMTRKILPAFGEHLQRRSARGETLSYSVTGHVYFLSRPLKSLATALHDSSLGWKTPVRALRNAYRSAVPPVRLPDEYGLTQVPPNEIPQELWPRPTSEVAVTARSAELLQHFETCPVLSQTMCFLLHRQQRTVAYFVLMLGGGEVRVADYGPGGLDESTAHVLGAAAQAAARKHYPQALRISAATSESPVKEGFLRSGLHLSFSEEIRAIVAEESLRPVQQYRLTYLDCDALWL